MRFFTPKLFFLGLCGLLFSSVLGATPAQGQTERAARIAFAAYRHGQWDIYSLAPDGSDLHQLTDDPFEDTDPAYSPDGEKLAFASRRNQNWDIYVLDLLSGQETRLTDSPHYDGAPVWSPDGQRLAYESYQNGDLDLWLIDATGSTPATDLTADSDAGDFGPAWRPDGQALAFSSWRDGQKDLYLLDMTGNGSLTRLTNTPTAEDQPTWSPDGRTLAFVVDNLGDREVFSLDTTGSKINPLTWLGRTDGPTWSPDGKTLAAIFQRWDGESIALQTVSTAHQLPRLLTPVSTIQGRLSWSDQAVDFGRSLSSLADNGESPLYTENVTLSEEPGHEPYSMVRLNDLDAGTPWLADTVDDSFQAWRFRLRDEVGYDFLGHLSDAARDVASYSETSQYASWHKSGRAVDTLFDYYLKGQLAHEIVREDYSGETYWRVLLRCVDQSGRCGRPSTANPWNYSSRARTEIAPEQGGIEKSNLSGYYVDMTALAREYGWQRISSHDDKDFSWTWHFLAFEYWHYQKRLDGDQHLMNWYQAMRQIYPDTTLTRFFTWQKMRAIGDEPHLIALKGVPLPLDVKPWWKLVEQK